MHKAHGQALLSHSVASLMFCPVPSRGSENCAGVGPAFAFYCDGTIDFFGGGADTGSDAAARLALVATARWALFVPGTPPGATRIVAITLDGDLACSLALGYPWMFSTESLFGTGA